MKILMINSEYPPLGGGQGNANFYLVTNLLKMYNNIEIDIITSSTNKYNTEKKNNLCIHYLNIGKKNKNFLYQSVKNLLTFTIKGYFFTKKMIKKNKYDLIVAWSGIPAGYIASRFRNKIPFIVLLRGADVPFYDKRWQKLDRYIFRFTSPAMWKNAEAVITNSTGLKNLANKVYDNQIDILYNGVDTSFFNPSVHEKTDKLIIASTGRVNKIKGFDLIIKAISKMKNNSNIELHIAGSGPEENNLKNLTKTLNLDKNIYFHGRLDKLELVKLYSNCNLFCLTSYNEGMSNALLEAMSSSLAVIVSDVGGASELVRDNGFIVNAGDIEMIKSKLEFFDKNREILYKMGKRSREITVSEFSWDIISQKFIKIIQEALTNNTNLSL